MIWAVSPYCGELDVLEIKLGTIADQIDRYVLAEAPVDQRGNPKPMHNPLEMARFEPWHDKITYVVVDDMPVGPGHELDWQRERHQRNALIRGMDGLDADDVVLISDLDEVPRPEALAQAIANPPSRILMDMHVYRLNWRWVDRDPWIGTLCMALTGREVRDNHRVGVGISQTMLHRFGYDPPGNPGVPRCNMISGGGWHLTYQGSVERIRTKMTGIADKFYEQLIPDHMKAVHGPEYFLTDEWINASITTGRDVYARDYRPSDWVDLDELPPYVQANPERFAHMLVPKPVV